MFGAWRHIVIRPVYCTSVRVNMPTLLPLSPLVATGHMASAAPALPRAWRPLAPPAVHSPAMSSLRCATDRLFFAAPFGRLVGPGRARRVNGRRSRARHPRGGATTPLGAATRDGGEEAGWGSDGGGSEAPRGGSGPSYGPGPGRRPAPRKPRQPPGAGWRDEAPLDGGAQQASWQGWDERRQQRQGQGWEQEQEQEQEGWVRRQQRQQRGPGGPPPDVILLTQREIQALLPIGATGEQYAYFWGGAETAVQRLGVSFLGFVATVNLTALIAVPSVTFFLWAPVALAARRNSAARRGRNLGIWRARVLAVTTRVADRGFASFDAARGGGRTERVGTDVLSLLVGDYSGARVELRVPLMRHHAKIREGDEVHMVVGSDESYFARFEAVREAYFPAAGMWVGEYPFLDRRAMPAISGRISRSAEEREAWARSGGGGGDDGGRDPTAW